MVSSLAKEAEVASTAGSNRTCSNEKSRKNQCGDGKTLTTRGRVLSKELICYGCG